MDHTAEIARIRALLDTGATSVSIEGQTVSIDPDALRRRLRELQSQSGRPTQRPRVASIDLTNAF